MIDPDHIREVLEQFGLSAAIDILLISIVVFATLRLLSGTRAMTLFRGGLLLVLVAVMLGRVFDLTVMNFVVENGITVLLVGAAVIFQPELRRGLDRLGRTGLRDFLHGGIHEDVIDVVATAAARMSAERHGGLIVLERETGLQDVIDTGVRVDARLGPELLASIFYPNSALHDMAVVLRDDRVVAAGCELPLANQLPPGSRKLGTRHRAAIGITEQTDALSIVVSEETGGISVAHRGKLMPVRDEQRLRDTMGRLLGGVENGGASPSPVSGSREATARDEELA